VFVTDWKVIGPELFLGTAVQLLLLLGVWYGSRSPYPILLKPIAVLSMWTVVLTLWLMESTNTFYGSVWNDSFVFDSLARNVQIWILLGTLISLGLSLAYSNKEKMYAYESSIFMLFAAFGLIGLVAAQDFLAFYLTLELQSFSFYILAASKRTSQFSTESGLKYFVLGAVASGFLLFGGSLLYGATGSLSFTDWMNLNLVIPSTNMFLLGMLFMFVGILFKVSAFPFHVWTPDVYEGAPTSVTAFFALVPKIGMFLVLAKLLSGAFYVSLPYWQTVLAVVALGSMVIGSLGALGQRKLKRLLAYSTISHVGFIVLGFSTGAVEGIQGAFFYLMIYFIMTIASFALLIGWQYSNTRLKSVQDLAGLGRQHPVLGLGIAMLFFSLAGIPPLAGFFSKYVVFQAALASQFYVITLLAVVTSVIGAVYYLRIVKTLFFPKETSSTPTTIVVWNDVGAFPAYLFAFSVTFLMVFWFYPTPLLMIAQSWSYTLFP